MREIQGGVFVYAFVVRLRDSRGRLRLWRGINVVDEIQGGMCLRRACEIQGAPAFMYNLGGKWRQGQDAERR